MPVVWSTDNVAEPQRFDYWRAAISHAFVPLEPERPRNAEFHGQIDTFGPVSMRASTVAADSHHVQLARSSISRQRANPFFVNLLRRGHAEVAQNGEVQCAAPGDVYIVDSSAPWSVNFTTDFEIFCLEIDESTLRHRLGARGRMNAPVLSGSRGAGCVLSRYMSLIRGLPEDELEGMQLLMIEHCASLLGRANTGAEITAPALRDRRATLNRALAFIDANLTNPKLSPDAACRALRISRSYLYKVLAESGQTFDGCVRASRLAACRNDLSRHPEKPIAQIALNWGFTDVASFNRAYKREFGEPPSMLRR